MDRRRFLGASSLVSIAAGINASIVFALEESTSSSEWKTHKLRYEIDVAQQGDEGTLWLPIPQDMGNYQRLLSVNWEGDTTGATLHREQTYGVNIFALKWREKIPRLSVTTRVAVRDRNRGTPNRNHHDMKREELYLRPTEHMPIDGIVAVTANEIIDSFMTPDDKARAIYNWVVDNTFRKPTTRGCGMGDIKFMLETGDLAGKCADINSLFVGLARAAGLPARESYGVRVAPSKKFNSLGSSGNISKAQHCRAEYFSPRYGWTAVDPADVRKVVLQEELALDDPKIIALRDYLFGNWEMNWVGFNRGRDFALTPPASTAVPYFMYPYAETAKSVIDGRDPGTFAYNLYSES